MQPLTKTHTPLSGTLFMDNVIWLALSRAIRWLWSLLHLDLRRGKFVASFWRSSALATFTSFSCVWGRTISNLTLVTQKHFNEPPVEDRVPCVFCFYYRSCQAAISAGKCKFFLSDRRTSCIFMAEIKTVMHLRAEIPLHITCWPDRVSGKAKICETYIYSTQKCTLPGVRWKTDQRTSHSGLSLGQARWKINKSWRIGRESHGIELRKLGTKSKKKTTTLSTKRNENCTSADAAKKTLDGWAEVG